MQFENNKFPGPIVDKHTILEYVLLEKKSIINAGLNDIFVEFHRKKHDKGTNHSHEQFVLPLDDPWQQLLVANQELATIKKMMPSLSEKKAALLLAINAVSDQLEKQEELDKLQQKIEDQTN